MHDYEIRDIIMYWLEERQKTTAVYGFLVGVDYYGITEEDINVLVERIERVGHEI